MIFARAIVIFFALGLCASAVIGVIDPSIGADDPAWTPDPFAAAAQSVVTLAYAALLIAPPRFFLRPIFYYSALALRFLAFGVFAITSAAIILQQASSFLALLFLFLIPGALFCIPSGLSVFELFYARRSFRSA